MFKVPLLLLFGFASGIGSYFLYHTYSSPPTVLSSATDTVLIATQCNEYAQTYPGKKMPKVCAGITPGPSTPTGTSAPTPGSTTPQPGQPYADAPACPPSVHDKRKFHSLWNAELGCHYDHHHGDNPHELDSILGTDLFAKMGGDISYPWQTFSTAGLENDLKHAGYFWHVRKDIPCTP